MAKVSTGTTGTSNPEGREPFQPPTTGLKLPGFDLGSRPSAEQGGSSSTATSSSSQGGQVQEPAIDWEAIRAEQEKAENLAKTKAKDANIRKAALQSKDEQIQPAAADVMPSVKHKSDDEHAGEPGKAQAGVQFNRPAAAAGAAPASRRGDSAVSTDNELKAEAEGVVEEEQPVEAPKRTRKQKLVDNVKKVAPKGTYGQVATGTSGKKTEKQQPQDSAREVVPRGQYATDTERAAAPERLEERRANALSARVPVRPNEAAERVMPLDPNPEGMPVAEQTFELPVEADPAIAMDEAADAVVLEENRQREEAANDYGENPDEAGDVSRETAEPESQDPELPSWYGSLMEDAKKMVADSNIGVSRRVKEAINNLLGTTDINEVYQLRDLVMTYDVNPDGTYKWPELPREFRLENPNKNRMKSTDQINSFMQPGSMLIGGTTINEETGEVETTPEVASARWSIIKMYKLDDVYTVDQMVAHVFGITPDRDNRMFLKERIEGGSYDISEDMYIAACRQIVYNQQNFGFPFMHAPDAKWGDTKRFCIPVVTDELARKICNGKPGNAISMKPERFVDYGRSVWLDYTFHDINARASAKQREVLLDFVDWVDSTRQDNFTLSGRPDEMWTDVRVLNEVMVEAAKGMENNHEILDLVNETNRHIWKMKAEYDKNRRDGNIKYYKDSQGRLRPANKETQDAETLKRMATGGKVANILAGMNTVSRGLSVLDVGLALGAAAEHAVSAAENQVLISISRGRLNSKMLESGSYKPTEATYNVVNNERVVSTLNKVWGMWVNDRQQLNALLAEGESLAPNEQKDLLGKIGEISGAVASGMGVLQKRDLKQFIDFLYLEVMDARTHDNVHPAWQSMDREMYEQMWLSDPEGMIAQAMMSAPGRNAMNKLIHATIGRPTILGDLYTSLARKHPAIDTAFMLTVGKFPVYEFASWLNRVGSIIPVMNTVRYLAYTGIDKATANTKYATNYSDIVVGGSYWSPNHKAEKEKLNEMLGNALGKDEMILTTGDGAWRRGLYQNVALDMMRLGREAFITGAAFIIVSALGGIGDPGDDDKIFEIEEYKIGGENGVPLRGSWLWQDGFYGLGVWSVMTYLALEGKTDRLPQIYFSSISDLAIGSFVGQWYDATFGEMSIAQAQREIEMEYADGDVFTASDLMENPKGGALVGAHARANALKMVSNYFTPGFLRMIYGEYGILGNDDLAHSKNVVINEETGERQGVTYDEMLIRRVTENNLVAAFICNMMKGFNGNSNTSGYLATQMPLIEMVDQANMEWNERLGISNNDSLTKEDVDTAILNLSSYITIAGGYVDPERPDYSDEVAKMLMAQGVYIPGHTRTILADTLRANIANIRAQQAYDFRVVGGEFLGNGKSYEENQVAKQARVDADNEKIAELQKVVDILYSFYLPTEPAKYNMWKTDWNARYEKADGTPASQWDWMMSNALGDKSVQRILYPYGNHRSTLDLLGDVDDRYGTWDYQTPSAWWDSERTNEKLMRELYGDMAYTDGAMVGQPIVDSLFGYGESDIPLESMRALIPVAGTFDNAWKDGVGTYEYGKFADGTTIEDRAKENGDTLYDGSNGGSGGSGGRSYGSYYRSSGGSSYNPKIYSNPAYNLNADKPQTMYAKTPNYTRYDYLRPGFETKGSREAYKRSDI